MKANNSDESYAARIRRLERQKAYYEDQLKTRCEEVEYLKLVKEDLEIKVQLKEAIAAWRRHQQQRQQ